MKRNLSLTVIVILAVLLGACGQAAPTAAPAGAAGPIKIGMANFSQCCPYFIGMNDAVSGGSQAPSPTSRSSPPMPMATRPSSRRTSRT